MHRMCGTSVTVLCTGAKTQFGGRDEQHFASQGLKRRQTCLHHDDGQPRRTQCDLNVACDR